MTHRPFWGMMFGLWYWQVGHSVAAGVRSGLARGSCVTEPMHVFQCCRHFHLDHKLIVQGHMCLGKEVNSYSQDGLICPVMIIFFWDFSLVNIYILLHFVYILKCMSIYVLSLHLHINQFSNFILSKSLTLSQTTSHYESVYPYFWLPLWRGKLETCSLDLELSSLSLETGSPDLELFSLSQILKL